MNGVRHQDDPARRARLRWRSRRGLLENDLILTRPRAENVWCMIAGSTHPRRKISETEIRGIVGGEAVEMSAATRSNQIGLCTTVGNMGLDP